MKKVWDLFLVLVLTVLTACGGGGRGGVYSDFPSVQDVVNGGNAGNGGSNTTTGGNGSSGNTDPSDPTGGNGGSNTTTGGNGGSGNTDPSDPNLPVIDDEIINLLNQSDFIKEYGSPFKKSDFHKNSNGEMFGVEPSCEDLSTCNPIVTGEMTFGGSSLGLKYSDFGWWKRHFVGKDNEGNVAYDYSDYHSVFAGGKESNKIIPTGNDAMTFKGKVYAVISSVFSGDMPAYTVLGGKVVSGNATLVVNPTIGNQSEKLTVNFDNWYDMTFMTDNDGRASVDVKKGASYVDNGYNFEGRIYSPILESQYFGNNNKVEESVGTFGVVVGVSNNVDFGVSSSYNALKGAYGAKRVD